MWFMKWEGEQREPGFPPSIHIEDACFTMCVPYPVALEVTAAANVLSSGFVADRPREVTSEKSNTPQ